MLNTVPAPKALEKTSVQLFSEPGVVTQPAVRHARKNMCIYIYIFFFFARAKRWAKSRAEVRRGETNNKATPPNQVRVRETLWPGGVFRFNLYFGAKPPPV